MALFVMVLMTVGLAGCTSVPVPVPMPVPSPPVPVDVAVFLRNDVTEPQKQAIEARLHTVPSAAGVTFQTREEAYARFKETFKDSPELIATITPEALPESFRFTLADRAAAEPILAELRQLPGVDEVTMPPKATPSPTR
jgi:cell division protein FtsX